MTNVLLLKMMQSQSQVHDSKKNIYISHKSRNKKKTLHRTTMPPPKKLFRCIDPVQNQIIYEFATPNARNAALKADTKGVKTICLVEQTTGKLHIFRGGRIQLDEDMMNEYTKQRNITCRPSAQKLGYANLKRSIQDSEMQIVSDTFLQMQE